MQTILYGLRKKAGLSQAELAKIIGISENSYRSKELGYTDFKSTEMFIIADVFHREINEIFLPQKDHETCPKIIFRLERSKHETKTISVYWKQKATS